MTDYRDSMSAIERVAKLETGLRLLTELVRGVVEDQHTINTGYGLVMEQLALGGMDITQRLQRLEQELCTSTDSGISVVVDNSERNG